MPFSMMMTALPSNKSRIRLFLSKTHEMTICSSASTVMGTSERKMLTFTSVMEMASSSDMTR